MNILNVEKVSKAFGEKVLLDNVTLGINKGDKIGIIGVNGTGKSTLLKIIAGIEEPDEGNIIKGRKVTVTYLAQSPDYIKDENVHVPCGQGNIQENCDEYNKMLAENPVDIQLLGIGSNGHIGFNEPGTDFDSRTHYVDLKESTIQDNARLFFDGDVNAVPKQAISMGIQNIMEAKKVVLIACGKNKEDAVKGMIEGPVTPELPASVLQNHKDVTVIIDEAAAGLLEKKY